MLLPTLGAEELLAMLKRDGNPTEEVERERAQPQSRRDEGKTITRIERPREKDIS